MGHDFGWCCDLSNGKEEVEYTSYGLLCFRRLGKAEKEGKEKEV